MRIGAALVIVASIVALAGCASAPLPAPISRDEVSQVLERNNELWWKSMFPNEPMPVVEPVEYVTPLANSWDLVAQCVEDLDLEGVTVSSSGEGYSIMVAQDSDVSGTSMDDFNRAQFICSMSYPTDPGTPEELGMYSVAQLEYLYNYFESRLGPCLSANGIAFGGIPSRENFIAQAPYLPWTPYLSAKPMPATQHDWLAIDLKCPPPPIAVDYRPVDSDFRG